MKVKSKTEIVEKSPLKIIPKTFITWRVHWIGKYSKTIKHFDINDESSAYRIMCFFLKNKTCSWISSQKKTLLISYNHPLWYPHESQTNNYT